MRGWRRVLIFAAFLMLLPPLSTTASAYDRLESIEWFESIDWDNRNFGKDRSGNEYAKSFTTAFEVEQNDFVLRLTGYQGEKMVNGRSERTDYFLETGEPNIHKYVGSGGDVVVPDGVLTFDGAKIFDFTGRDHITSVVLPDGLKEIQDWAFEDMGGLVSVTIPDSVTEWGYAMFEGCTSLTEITVGNKVIKIGEGECKDYSGIDYLATVGREDKGTKYVGTFGFVEQGPRWRDENGFIIGNMVNLNGWNPFYVDGSKESDTLIAYRGPGGDVVIPESVRHIARGAFAHRTDITSVVIPEGVIYMDYYVFYGCSNLTSVQFPSTLKYTSGYFGKDTAMRSENDIRLNGEIGQGVGSWATTNFGGCGRLEELVNVPHPNLAKNLPLNLEKHTQWVNPGQHIAQQSPRIVAQAQEIIGNEEDPYTQAKLICKWVCDNLSYDYNYYLGKTGTVTITPESVLDSKKTICDGYARLTSALLQAVGIPALYVTGSAYGVSGWELHAWNEAFIDGRWVVLDNTFEDTGKRSYFDCGLAGISADHKIGSRPEASSTDTPSNWAQDGTREAICEDLVPFDLQSAYRTNITREEFCRLMVALIERTCGKDVGSYLSSKELTASEPFSDTDDAEVAAAYTLGIVTGTSATTFNPGGGITRQEAAVMLSRTARLLGLPEGKGDAFADAAKIASWAADSTSHVLFLGVMSGVGDGNFSPLASYSREQACLTALRLLRCI